VQFVLQKTIAQLVVGTTVGRELTSSKLGASF
jgi:hypothetical protein